MFPSFVAAAAAACLTLCIPGSDRISGASAFHLQGGSPKLALGFEAPHSAQRAAALATPSSSPSSLLSVGPHKEALAGTQQLAAAFSQQECSKLDEGDSSALALAAFSRCHKPLLNDRGPEIPDGNLCMLLRGCDAHQRMISPLELKTNAAALPGAAPALVMAAKGQAAVDRLCEQMVEDLRTAEKQCRGLPLVDLLKLEVSKVHRLLQYATAAGLKKNFLNTHALQVMLELYEEADLDSNYVLKVLQGLKDFYKGEMDAAGFREFFSPAYEEVILQFHEAKKLVRPAKKVPVASLPFEPTPDPRTLTPLIVDILSFKDKLRERRQTTSLLP